MSNIDNGLQLIFDYCDKNVNDDKIKLLIDSIKKKVSKMNDNQKMSVIKDFKKKIESRNQVTEGISSALKGMTIGALLATCLIQPAYAKTIVDNIQTHHPVTAKYESGKKGYDCVTKDNYGGYSYGKDQISTERRDGKPSTFDYFMKYAKEKDSNIEYHLRRAGGWDAAFKGDPKFIDEWCKLTYRKDFQDVYNGFMRDKEFIPVYQRMDKQTHQAFDKITTWASSNKAVQAAVNSAIIQHGKNGAFKLIKKVINKRKFSTPEQFIKALYDIRMIQYPKYKDRYVNELKDVSNYLKNKESKI